MGTYQLQQDILYFMEAAACITGFIYWYKIKHTHWKWFPVYLLLIVIGEQTGNYLNSIESYQVKAKMYNYFIIPFEFLFIFWLFYREHISPQGKRLIMACAAVYILAFFADQFYFSHKKMFFSSFSYSMGNLGILIVVIAYFKRLVTSDAIISYKTSILFWVAVGLLVFYLGTLPYFSLSRLLFYQYRPTYDLYTNIMFICDWIMYGLFITGFIWGKPRY